jgi:hypothetical protein
MLLEQDQEHEHEFHLAMQTFFGSVKNSAFAKPP